MCKQFNIYHRCPSLTTTTKSGIMSSIYLTCKSILSNVMYCLKKLSEVLGLNWSKSLVYCISLKGDWNGKMYFQLIVSLKINPFGIYYICLNQKCVKDKDAKEPVVRWSGRAQVVWGRQWGSDLPTSSPAPLLLPRSGAMAQTSLKGHRGQETEKARLCIPQVEQDLFHVKYNFLIFCICY